MTIPATLPDVELVVVNYLRLVAAVDALIDGRVFTVIPYAPTFPMLRVVRVGGAPLRDDPLRFDVAELELAAYGGSKADARRLIDTARAALGLIETVTHPAAVVIGAAFGEARYLPDPDFTPAKPRYILAAAVTIHP